MYIRVDIIENNNGRTVKHTASVVAKQKKKKKVSFKTLLKLASFTCRRVTL